MSTSTPKKPEAGGLVDNVPWTGGKRDLPKTAKPNPKSPFCFRPTDYKSSLKVYELAVKGEERKFGNDLLDYPLLAFCKTVHKHLIEFGLDNVFYFKNKAGVEVNIIEQYTTFTLQEIKDKVNDLKTSDGDDYDQTNLDWSETYLVHSISIELHNAIMNKIAEVEVSGPVLWMYIVQYVESNTATAHQALLDQLKNITVKSFAGENVKTCTEKLSTICRRLALADALPKNIGILLCDALMACSAEEFRLSFISLRNEFDLQPKFKSWEEVLMIADRRYQSLIDSKKWIQPNPDKAATSFALQPRNPRQVKCHRCGKFGHFARDCSDRSPPNKDAATPKATIRAEDKWKFAPPKKDEPHQKVVKERTWLWCGRCKRWTWSHLTKDHKDSCSAENADPKDAAATATLTTAEDSKPTGGSGLASAHSLSMVSGF